MNAARSQIIKMKSGVRGARYGEVLIIRGRLFTFTATVYNTLGCNDCPPEQWKKLSADEIKKTWNARAAVLNGPRYFLMDAIGQFIDEPPTSVFFDGLEMKERATLNISLWTLFKGRPAPYRERTIQRATEFVFNKGSEVYQLVTPQHAYVMQSYAQIVDPRLSESDLPALHNKLTLPAGWQFKSFKLESDLVLRTLEAQQAVVMQDDLLNTYQRID